MSTSLSILTKAKAIFSKSKLLYFTLLLEHPPMGDKIQRPSCGKQGSRPTSLKLGQGSVTRGPAEMQTVRAHSNTAIQQSSAGSE